MHGLGIPKLAGTLASDIQLQIPAITPPHRALSSQYLVNRTAEGLNRVMQVKTLCTVRDIVPYSPCIRLNSSDKRDNQDSQGPCTDTSYRFR